MFDTNVTIVGNVLTAPEWRRTSNTNSLVANFKVASTARRLDRESGRWIDGNSLRVRVNCWRKLAEGVASSIMVGDPVIVAGRLYTRDWTDAEGNPRTMYEMEAVAVGHDLARGRGKFLRNRPTLATSAVQDPQADAHVRGEATEAVPSDQAPARPGDGLFDDGEPDFADESGGYGFRPDAVARPGMGHLPSDAPGPDRGGAAGAVPAGVAPYDGPAVELTGGESRVSFDPGGYGAPNLPTGDDGTGDDQTREEPGGEQPGDRAQPAGDEPDGRAGMTAPRRGRRVGARMSVPA